MVYYVYVENIIICVNEKINHDKWMEIHLNYER